MNNDERTPIQIEIEDILTERMEKANKYVKSGVIILDPLTFFASETVEIGEGSVIYPCVTLRGSCKIGKNVKIFSGSVLEDAEIGDETVIDNSKIINSIIGKNATIGPFSFIREQAVIGDYSRIGDFVEIKNSILGTKTKAAHLSYIGDANLGYGCNVGCGVVFANYDGREKSRTTVGDRVFIGSNSNLVAPISIQSGAYIAAGSTVTVNLGESDFCIARAKEYIKKNGANGRF